jgi:hypothetical protein
MNEDGLRVARSQNRTAVKCLQHAGRGIVTLLGAGGGGAALESRVPDGVPRPTVDAPGRPIGQSGWA